MIGVFSWISGGADASSVASEEESSLFEDCHDLGALAAELCSAKYDLSDWVDLKKEIQAFVHEHRDNLRELDTFFTRLCEFGLKQDMQRAVLILPEILDVSILTQTIQNRQAGEDKVPFASLLDWAKQNAELLPKPVESSWRERLCLEWKKYGVDLLHTVPNLINLVLGVFDLFHSHKKYTTLWEKYLITQMACSLLLIPYLCVKALEPLFVATVKTYAVAVLVIVGFCFLVACYKRWLRPLPDEIPNMTNLDKRLLRGEIAPKIGQGEELQQLINALDSDQNVLLVGLSGEGKTALFHHFLHEKHEGKLSDKLQKKRAYEINCGLMMTSVSHGFGDLIDETREKIQGYENEVILYLDEFFQLANKPEALQTFKKRILEDQPHVPFVGAITMKQMEELEKLDNDGSLLRRVEVITIKPYSDEQMENLLYDWVHRFASDICVTRGAIDTIVALSNNEDDVSQIGRAAKGLKLLEKAVQHCREVYSPRYVSCQVIEAKEELANLQMRARRDGVVDDDLLKKSKELREKIADLEKGLTEDKKQLEQIKKTIAFQEQTLSDYYRLTHRLAEAVDVSQISEKEQTQYLWYAFYGIKGIKEDIKSRIDSFEQTHEDIFIQVNEDLIRYIGE